MAFAVKDGVYKLKYGRIISFINEQDGPRVILEVFVANNIDEETSLPVASSSIEARNSSILPGQLVSHIRRMPLFETANSSIASDFKTLIVLQDPVVLTT